MFPRRFGCLAALLVLTACAGGGRGGEGGVSSEGMARMAQALREKGELGSAIDYYRRALVADSKNAKAISGLATTLDQFGDKAGALAAYKDGVEARPKDAELRRSYGKLLLAVDDPAAARRQYEKAVDLDGDDVRALTGLGVSLDYLGDHTKAQGYYERALKREPRNLATLNNLAYSHILSHRFDRAIALLEPEANNRAATPALRQNLALAYGMAGMDADAERTLKKDMSPEKLREAMDYYRRQRAEMKVAPKAYAEIGTYATEAMALAQIQKMRPDLAKAGGDLKPVVLPEVATPGGTPRFTVRMLGCTRPDDVSRLCDTLAHSGIPCTPRGKEGG